MLATKIFHGREYVYVLKDRLVGVHERRCGSLHPIVRRRASRGPASIVCQVIPGVNSPMEVHQEPRFFVLRVQVRSFLVVSVGKDGQAELALRSLLGRGTEGYERVVSSAHWQYPAATTYDTEIVRCSPNYYLCTEEDAVRYATLYYQWANTLRRQVEDERLVALDGGGETGWENVEEGAKSMPVTESAAATPFAYSHELGDEDPFGT